MGVLEEAVANGEISESTKEVFEMGMEQNKIVVRKAFEEFIKVKPWITAAELYQRMKEAGVV